MFPLDEIFYERSVADTTEAVGVEPMGEGSFFRKIQGSFVRSAVNLIKHFLHFLETERLFARRERLYYIQEHSTAAGTICRPCSRHTTWPFLIASSRERRWYLRHVTSRRSYHSSRVPNQGLGRIWNQCNACRGISAKSAIRRWKRGWKNPRVVNQRS